MICSIWLFLYGQMKLQTSLHNYFKKHPVLNNIVLWRKLHAGKQQHTPHMGLLFLLEVFILSPEPVIHQNILLLMVKQEHQQYRDKLLQRLLRTFVCIECPWTSLARVLIKSLLAIPWRSPVWGFPCHPPIPHLSLIPPVSLFLDMPFELPSVSSPTSKLW